MPFEDCRSTKPPRPAARLSRSRVPRFARKGLYKVGVGRWSDRSRCLEGAPGANYGGDILFPAGPDTPEFRCRDFAASCHARHDTANNGALLPPGAVKVGCWTVLRSLGPDEEPPGEAGTRRSSRLPSRRSVHGRGTFPRRRQVRLLTITMATTSRRPFHFCPLKHCPSPDLNTSPVHSTLVSTFSLSSLPIHTHLSVAASSIPNLAIPAYPATSHTSSDNGSKRIPQVRSRLHSECHQRHWPSDATSGAGAPLLPHEAHPRLCARDRA